MKQTTEQKIKNELERVNNLNDLITVISENFDTGANFDWQIKFKIRYFGYEFLRGMKQSMKQK